MVRTPSSTLLAAQQAATNVPYIHLLFTSKDLGTTYDYSSDQAGRRILLIDHTEEPYNDYATIVLRNNDRTVPNLKGYWTEIGYGYVTGSGNEYVGDATSEPGVPRLWVKHQQDISVQGKIVTLLELEGMWARLRETLMRLGNKPHYHMSYTDLTAYRLVQIILKELSFDFPSGQRPDDGDAPTEDDGIINTLQPQFEINVQPFESAAPLIYRLLHMTKSYLKALDDLEFEVKYPQAADAVDLTYYSDQTPYFYEYMERRNVLAHNHFVVFGNEGDDERWSDYKASDSPFGVDQDEIDAYQEVYKLVLAGSLTTQAQVDERAAALLARAKFEQLAGRMYAPHDARLELYDKIEVSDSR